VRIISQQQQLLRIDYEVATSVDAAVERALADACAAHVRQADAVIVSDYAKGLLTHHGCREVIAQAHAAGKSVLVDPRPQHVAFYDACDVITPNWKESLGLAGEADAEATPANIARVGAAVSRRLGCDVLLTLGAQGMAYFSRDGGEALRVPAIRQEVFDVSGAGDTVAAAFALARAGGCDAAAAVSFANRAAAVVVGKRGTATVTPAELLAAAP
jgi:D-beta-D-heptose 7-phosphate kinase/D-beta-D-heptose 1-phosphate adenosyltransferase